MALDTRQPIGLTWQPLYGDILDKAERQIQNTAPFRTNTLIVLRRLLLMLRQGRKNLTPVELINAIYKEEAPKGGWTGFDHRKWMAYVPKVVGALRSSDPSSALRL